LTPPGRPGYPAQMTARRAVAVLIPLVLAAAAACSQARSAPPPRAEGEGPEAVFARIDGHAITQKEVDERADSSLQRLKDEEYEARRRALDELITERLMDAQATAQGISRDELLRREVEGKVAPPTKADVKDLYDRNRDRVGGRTLAELAPEIERSILQTRSAERAQAYLAELRSKASVAVTLPQPRSQVPIPADARVLGPDKAPVTIVEFSDYLCPYCQKAQSVVDEVLAKNQGKVRFIHRDFLLGRPRSMAVARAAQCAADQGKFWDYRRSLLEAPGEEVAPTHREANRKRRRLEGLCVQNVTQSLVVSATRAEEDRVLVLGDRIVGVELQRTSELRFRRRPVPVVEKMNDAEPEMGLRQPRGQPQRLERGGPRARSGGGPLAITELRKAEQCPALGEPGVGERVVGILLDGLLEVLDAQRQALRRPLVRGVASAEV